MDTVAHKVAVISGGGSGIGRGTALALAAAGAHVVVTDIDEDAAIAAAQEASQIGAASVGTRLDVRSQTDFDSARDLALSTFGTVDIVMNNVGLLSIGAPEHIPVSEWERIISVNLLSIVRSNASFLPVLLDQGTGHIVNTASTAGLYAYSYERLPYSATKSAIVALSESLALYLRPKGIGITCLCPGPVLTNISRGMTFWGPPVKLHSPADGLELLSGETVGEQVRDAILQDRFLLLTHPQLQQETLIPRAHDPEAFLARQVGKIMKEDSHAT
jgi:NAD(P)-dependent dehydrogenase (short-subunit alcohol dehydrogenase family)